MYVLPVGTFLALTAMRDHDDLLRSGALVEFKHHLGKAVFVSHQWTSVEILTLRLSKQVYCRRRFATCCLEGARLPCNLTRN